MKNTFTIRYQSTNNGKPCLWTSFRSSNDPVKENTLNLIKSEYDEDHKDDPNYKFISIVHDNARIDTKLVERMAVVRSICELGHRIRAENKIKNRQPLTVAHVYLKDSSIRDYMLFLDKDSNGYYDLISEELNVLRLVFINDPKSFLDVDLKPNFKVLGPKGLGKAAQSLKADLTKMTMAEKQTVFNELSAGGKYKVSDGIELGLEDLEVEYIPRTNFASASNKYGAVILDTKITPLLEELSFVAEFRSAFQQVRKDAQLSLADRVHLDVFCTDKQKVTLESYKNKLSNQLLAKTFDVHPNIDLKGKEHLAHKIEIDRSIISILMYREQ